MELTREHDGVLVADVVAEWAAAARPPLPPAAHRSRGGRVGRRRERGGAGARRRRLLPSAVRPREGRRAAGPAGPLLRTGRGAHQPWTRRASLTTRSKRARSSAAPSRRTVAGSSTSKPVQAHLARPAAGVPGAGPDVGPGPAVARLVGGVPVVVLAGEHQPEEVAAAPADDEHRPVLAPSVVLVVGHPRPHDLARIGPTVGPRAVLHVGSAAGAGCARRPGGTGRRAARRCAAGVPSPHRTGSSDVTCDTSAPFGHGGGSFCR